MARSLVMEEFHVTVKVPGGLAQSVYGSIRRTLNRTRFQTRLRRAILAVFRRCPTLVKIRVTLTR